MDGVSGACVVVVVVVVGVGVEGGAGAFISSDATPIVSSDDDGPMLWYRVSVSLAIKLEVSMLAVAAFHALTGLLSVIPATRLTVYVDSIVVEEFARSDTDEISMNLEDTPITRARSAATAALSRFTAAVLTKNRVRLAFPPNTNLPAAVGATAGLACAATHVPATVP